MESWFFAMTAKAFFVVWLYEKDQLMLHIYRSVLKQIKMFLEIDQKFNGNLKEISFKSFDLFAPVLIFVHSYFIVQTIISAGFIDNGRETS